MGRGAGTTQRQAVTGSSTRAAPRALAASPFPVTHEPVATSAEVQWAVLAKGAGKQKVLFSASVRKVPGGYTVWTISRRHRATSTTDHATAVATFIKSIREYLALGYSIVKAEPAIPGSALPEEATAPDLAPATAPAMAPATAPAMVPATAPETAAANAPETVRERADRLAREEFAGWVEYTRLISEANTAREQREAAEAGAGAEAGEARASADERPSRRETRGRWDAQGSNGSPAAAPSRAGDERATIDPALVAELTVAIERATANGGGPFAPADVASLRADLLRVGVALARGAAPVAPWRRTVARLLGRNSADAISAEDVDRYRYFLGDAAPQRGALDSAPALPAAAESGLGAAIEEAADARMRAHRTAPPPAMASAASDAPQRTAQWPDGRYRPRPGVLH